MWKHPEELQPEVEEFTQECIIKYSQFFIISFNKIPIILNYYNSVKIKSFVEVTSWITGWPFMPPASSKRAPHGSEQTLTYSDFVYAFCQTQHDYNPTVEPQFCSAASMDSCPLLAFRLTGPLGENLPLLQMAPLLPQTELYIIMASWCSWVTARSGSPKQPWMKRERTVLEPQLIRSGRQAVRIWKVMFSFLSCEQIAQS